jgi:hypothetical protein
MQQAMALEQLRVALDKYQGDSELQYKYYDTVLSAQVEEAKLAVQGVLDMVKAKQTATAAANGKGVPDGNPGSDKGSKTANSKQVASDDSGSTGI